LGVENFAVAPEDLDLDLSGLEELDLSGDD
jgi:hypothetical protein